MDSASAAAQVVERVNGIPAPIALVLTIVGCLVGLAWVVFIVARDGKKMSVKK